MDSLLFPQQPDVVGHRFLDTIDLDIMEQTIIDSVVEEISSSDYTVAVEPVLQRSHSEPVLKGGVIEAVDAEGLLEQFEEAAQSLQTDESVAAGAEKSNKPVFTLFTDTEQEDCQEKPGKVEKKELTKEVLQKLKTCTKSKSAVMLPMMVPAKRGRGRATTRGHPVALPANCTPRRLQRVMMQNDKLRDSIALEEATSVNANDIGKVTKLKDIPVTSQVSDSRSEVKSRCVQSGAAPDSCWHILDHDYFKSTDKEDLTVKKSHSGSNFIDDFEEGEIIEKENTCDNSKGLKGSKSREDLIDDNSNLFDKLPSYYTALSIPRKQFKKTAAGVTSRGGMTVHDFIERDSSPIRDTSTYSKLPDYFSSFTNSTKYDVAFDSEQKKCIDESKASSGYSSLNHSPDLSVGPLKTRIRSCSESRSRSRSRSVHGSSVRHRQSSYSSCSGYSSSGSSCSRSTCSKSSCCRSRSCSSDSARSISCSTCGSRSSRSRSGQRYVSRSPDRSLSRSKSRSVERSWRREHNMRSRRRRLSSRHSRHTLAARSRRSRWRRSSRSYSRSRSRSYSRSRSRSYSRSRSRDYRSRSSSREREVARRYSVERRREEKRKQREEAKEQQMKERRIVYVGGLPNNYTRHKLRDNFSRFGPIEHVQLHFRERGDNYGFVTFTYTCDAFAAIEKGNKIAALEKFDLCFGGRRQFCDVEYADLDGNKEIEEEYESKPERRNALDFDELLRIAKAGLKKS